MFIYVCEVCKNNRFFCVLVKKNRKRLRKVDDMICSLMLACLAGGICHYLGPDPKIDLFVRSLQFPP